MKRISESFKKAISKNGFSFVEIITACPEEYGRKNKIPDPIENMKWLRDASEFHESATPIDAIIQPDKIIVGEFVDIEKPEFTSDIWNKSREVQADLDRGGRSTNVTF